MQTGTYPTPPPWWQQCPCHHCGQALGKSQTILLQMGSGIWNWIPQEWMDWDWRHNRESSSDTGQWSRDLTLTVSQLYAEYAVLCWSGHLSHPLFPAGVATYFLHPKDDTQGLAVTLVSISANTSQSLSAPQPQKTLNWKLKSLSRMSSLLPLTRTHIYHHETIVKQPQFPDFWVCLHKNKGMKKSIQRDGKLIFEFSRSAMSNSVHLTSVI